VTICDELEGGFGWVDDSFMRRCAHALVEDGRVWVIDPFEADGVEERIRAAGEPAGVLQLLDRHNRDCAAFADRLGVPLLRLTAPAPFETIRIATPPRWQEIALWWPERRILVSPEALGTVRSYFLAPGERIGVHPLLRLTPPKRLARLEPEHILVGHGRGLHDDATAALRDALAKARRRTPGLVVSMLRRGR
jgi:hypothetical protein